MGNGFNAFFGKGSGNGTHGASQELFADYAGQVAAINSSRAVIEFNLDGTIITANQNFLTVMGYSLEEVSGKHHSMFVDASTRTSGEYTQFWERLNRGESIVKEFKRVAKGGKEVWIQASYNPIKNEKGKAFKIVKYARDITEQYKRNTDVNGQMDAINKSQAVIEFNMDGSILSANENFLAAMGYRQNEIQGRPHSMFVESEYANSNEYREFWSSLNRGEYQSGEFKRVGKGGKEIWIQASYNPIMNIDGHPFKVVKYASDISAQKQMQKTIEEVLGNTLEAMTEMQAGNLTYRMHGNFTGQFATLQSAVNSCFDKLQVTLSEIKSVAETVSTDSSEISQGNANLSERTVEQAANLQETASSMEEMTTTVKQNAANASNANNLVQSASEQARKGGVIVETAVQAMNGLNESSKKISDIIGVINDIAFQTNLLALNASVEAARAGNQGRGFAVVASEVRDLAGRSATAAKEIKELIEDSAKRVDESSELVNRSGNSLGEIVAGVEKVTGIVSEIATASKDQSDGISGVNKAISQIDTLTQQNAALVEQAAAASANLNGQANDLTRLVSSFKLESSAKAANQTTFTKAA